MTPTAAVPVRAVCGAGRRARLRCSTGRHRRRAGRSCGCDHRDTRELLASSSKHAKVCQARYSRPRPARTVADRWKTSAAGSAGRGTGLPRRPVLWTGRLHEQRVPACKAGTLYGSNSRSRMPSARATTLANRSPSSSSAPARPKNGASDTSLHSQGTRLWRDHPPARTRHPPRRFRLVVDWPPGLSGNLCCPFIAACRLPVAVLSDHGGEHTHLGTSRSKPGTSPSLFS